ncbi:MAG: serine/threonine-protein kinase [Kofleriaceae bacterium]
MATAQLMVGNYVIERELGRGGMGVVYVARHRVLGKPAAIKLLANPESSVDRFFNEGRAAMAIDHPGVVRVYDIGRASDGRAYIAMELLEGSSLALLLAQGPLPVRKAVDYARQIAEALSAVHAVQIVHRDLKPENVIVVAGDRVKLVDFGIAKLVGELANNVKTVSGALLGTPHYMSPEQGEGVRELDARSDLYSLGCVLYAMLTGSPPFSSTGLGALIAMHMYEPAPPLNTRCPFASPALQAVVERMLAKAPEDRFPDAQAVVEALADPRVLELESTNGAAATAAMAAVTPTFNATASEPTVRAVPVRSQRSATPPAQVAAPSAPARPRYRWLFALAAVASVAAVTAVILAGRSGSQASVDSPIDAAPVVTTVVDALVIAEAPPPDASDASPAREVVTITIAGAPASTEVRARGELFGVVPRIEVPRGTDAVILVLSRDGYRSLSVSIVPDRDREIAVKLRPRSSSVDPRESGEPTQDILTFPR